MTDTISFGIAFLVRQGPLGIPDQKKVMLMFFFFTCLNDGFSKCLLHCALGAPPFQSTQVPNGPKIEEIRDRPLGLKLSSELENFKRATRQTPIFVENSEGRD